MKVLNLQCGQGHAFEGWFASEEDLQSQREAGLLDCPLCASKDIVRLPSAPRLNLSGARAPEAASRAREEPASPERHMVEALWMKAVRHVLHNTEDVGERFSEEARRIHYGEASERGIRGKATAEQAQALNEEGIDVFSLPVPGHLKGPLQ
jgi:hypothetical protein